MAQNIEYAEPTELRAWLEPWPQKIISRQGAKAQRRRKEDKNGCLASSFAPLRLGVRLVFPAADTRCGTAGKSFKVVMTACMRKLLAILKAMVRRNETWRTA